MAKRQTIQHISLTGLFAALIALGTWITVPAAVPFTMQTFAVCLAVGLLGTKRGTLAVLTYIALGAVGLPVFSGFRGGVGALVGNTGGYVFGFALGALACGLLLQRFGRGVLSLSVAFGTCVAFCYLLGSLWYCFLYMHTTGAIGFGTVLATCVLPFIPADVLKIVLAVMLTRRLRGVVCNF